MMAVFLDARLLVATRLVVVEATRLLMVEATRLLMFKAAADV